MAYLQSASVSHKINVFHCVNGTYFIMDWSDCMCWNENLQRLLLFIHEHVLQANTHITKIVVNIAHTMNKQL